MTSRRNFTRLGAFTIVAAAGNRLSALLPSKDSNNLSRTLPPSPMLPHALVFQSGKPVQSRSEWPQRREEILHVAASQMYGVAPPVTRLPFHVVENDGTAFNGLARRRQVRLHLRGGATPPVADLLLYSPRHVRHAPVIAGLNFWGNHTLSEDPGVLLSRSWIESGENLFADLGCVQDHRATSACRGVDARRWPVKQLLERGYALCTVYRGDIDADLPDECVLGLRNAYPELSTRSDNFAAIGAWAWTLSRMLDYLETDPNVNARRTAVYGWSRLGKAAVWAGATDRRFAAVLSQESGAGGAKLFRRDQGEDIRRLNTVFPHWFCRNFRSYIDMDRELPFDQHLILAAVAPRPLFIASAFDDRLSDPPGEFASALLANEIYRFLGYDGLSSSNLPPTNSPLIGRISYQIRPGVHDVLPYDWQQYLRFLDMFL